LYEAEQTAPVVGRVLRENNQKFNQEYISNMEPILQFFDNNHLPERLQEVSKPFAEVARYVHDYLPRNPERTVALRKLLEAKDAAVRAAVYKEPNATNQTRS
jgi:hypothetical protein